MSLVIKVLPGEEVRIGEATVRCWPDGKDVRLAIEAPKSVDITRDRAKSRPEGVRS